IVAEQYAFLRPGVIGTPASAVVLPALLILLLAREGLLPVVIALYAAISLDINFILDPSSWAFRNGLIAVALIVALSAYAFWIAKAGRPLLGAGFLGEE